MYKTIREEVLNNIEENSVVVVFSGKALRKSEDSYYKFDANRNFFYLTGINRENFIYFYNNIEKKREILFIEKPNEKIEKWIGKYLKEEHAKEISGIEKVQYKDNFKDYFSKIMKENKIENVYLDIKTWDIDEPLRLAQDFAKLVVEKFPFVKIRNINNQIQEKRLIKNNKEIELTQKAIDITKEAVENMLKNSKPNVYEFELIAHYNFILGLNGVETSFDTIAASGENGVILHYIENNDIAKDGELVLCDLGVKYEEYNSDISRTFPVSGKFSERQKEVYEVVLRTNKKIIDKSKPGITLDKLNNIAKEELLKGCRELGIIEKDEDLQKYYYHSVSHFLGLDVHDVGDKNIKLKEGMLITVEPGLYIEEEKIGIRIEDDILITSEGSKNLSKNICKEVEEIENLMK